MHFGCCSVVQCVAVCYCVMQCMAVCFSVLHGISVLVSCRTEGMESEQKSARTKRFLGTQPEGKNPARAVWPKGLGLGGARRRSALVRICCAPTGADQRNEDKRGVYSNRRVYCHSIWESNIEYTPTCPHASGPLQWARGDCALKRSVAVRPQATP